MKYFLILTCGFYFFLLTFKLNIHNEQQNRLTKKPSKLYLVFIIVLFLSSARTALSKPEIIWNKSSNGIKEINIKSILIDLKKPERIFIGTDRAVYLSEDSGKYYKKILNVSGTSSEVNFLVQDQNNPKIIYAATGNGLFRSTNGGSSWQNIFKGKNSSQRYCNAVLVEQDKIYLATKEGLFFSLDNAKTWDRLSGNLGNIEIVSLSLGKDKLYIASADGIFSLNLDLKIQNKLYSIFTKEASDNSDLNNVDEPKGLSRITDIKVDSKNSQNIYFASDEGLFFSEDEGKIWKRFALDGLLSRNIQTILLDSQNGRLFVGSDRGIFGYDGKRWQQIYKGMVTNRINFLTSDPTSNLWAATEDGVFKGSSEKDNYLIKPDKIEDILSAFSDEPSIKEIQSQAIKYAEVQPEKISRWRKQAMFAAFMPSISLSYDKNVYGSASTKTDTTSYGTAMVGPRGWGLDFSWDLSELVWNSDQTSIDSRSKLMVELREDILDEVTRLYFERRRLQTELLISPPEEANVRLDKTMRLEELTASIDALTGGFLSQQLKQKTK